MSLTKCIGGLSSDSRFRRKCSLFVAARKHKRSRQPLSANTRRAYLGRVRQYCAYLAACVNNCGKKKCCAPAGPRAQFFSSGVDQCDFVFELHPCHLFGERPASKSLKKCDEREKRWPPQKSFQIQLLDHVIIGSPAPGRNSYFSFKEAGVIGGCLLNRPPKQDR